MGKHLRGAAPFGYRWEKKQQDLDPDEAPIRTLVYELFTAKQRNAAVARFLND